MDDLELPAAKPGQNEILVIGAKAEREKLYDHLHSLTLNTREQVRNLGVIIDPDLNFECHIRNVTKSSYFHLRDIARVRPFLSQADRENLIHAFITSRLDYCNVLLSSVSKKVVGQLKLVQNATARVLTKNREPTLV